MSSIYVNRCGAIVTPQHTKGGDLTGDEGSEICIYCDHSVAWGSGRYVNRIPADDGERVGFMCTECLHEDDSNGYDNPADDDLVCPF